MSNIVDLTKDGIIRKNKSNNFRNLLFSKKTLKPWEFKTNYIETDNLQNELVFTGSAKERAEKKYLSQYGTGDFCDRCGESLSKKPWSRVYNLCLNCYNEMKNDRKVELGYKQLQPWEESNDSIVIGMNKR